jgi:hypothetical protein
MNRLRHLPQKALGVSATLLVAACAARGGSTSVASANASASANANANANGEPAGDANRSATNEASHANAPPPAPASSTGPEAPAAPVSARAKLVDWLRSQLPPGGEIVDVPGAPIGVVHVAKAGELYELVARHYVELTDVYLTANLLKAMRVANKLKSAQARAGERIVIPSVVREAPKSADEERLGWPEDKVLRGVYVRGGPAASHLYEDILEESRRRGMNLIVLDAKDYDGWVTYPSKVPLAVESGATKNAPIRNLARTIRFAHAYGVRVAIRIASFEDEIVSKFRGDLSIQAKWKRPYKIGWLDPANAGAQNYVIDLAKEAIEAGADEIELDYVRYPVLGIKGADFKLEERQTTKIEVIRDFVRRVHAVTKPRHVALSLDVFGVIAEGKRIDIDMLGQDPALLAPECEALSPMVYPSHYSVGYRGFDVPGNHPEIVGYGTKGIVAQIAAAGVVGGAVIRPWLQGMSYKQDNFGPKYVADQMKSSEANGSHGWLIWNPGQGYAATWSALAPKDDGTRVVTHGPGAPARSQPGAPAPARAKSEP